MKKRFTKIGMLLFCVAAFSQASAQTRCGVDSIHKKNMMNPAYKATVEKFEQDIKDYVGASSSGTIITIPVVVHIIHQNGTENISNAQVLSQIAVLNKDFRRLNADTANTDPLFKPVAADVEVEFCLATKDPAGNPTNGINRQFNSDTTQTAAQMRQQYAWNNLNYMNIYVSRRVGCFSSFPWGPIGNDGIFITDRRFGTLGTVGQELYAEFSRFGRTGTHEAGHYLGLYHTFSDCGDTICNSSGDYVCDTPPEDLRWWAANCLDHTTNTCFDQTPDLPDQVDNYMNYNIDSCANMFSLGQKTRMIAALNTYRSNLFSATNLIATGCLTATGIHPTSGAGACQVYPNPFTEGTTIQFSNPKHELHSLSIYDVHGKLVRGYAPASGSSIAIERNSLPAGLYFFRLSAGQTIKANGKIIITD